LATLSSRFNQPSSNRPVMLDGPEFAPFGRGRDLEVVAERGSGRPARYCHTVDGGFKSLLLERLTTEPAAG